MDTQKPCALALSLCPLINGKGLQDLLFGSRQRRNRQPGGPMGSVHFRRPQIGFLGGIHKVVAAAAMGVDVHKSM